MLLKHDQHRLLHTPTPAAPDRFSGLAVSSSGYTLAPMTTVFQPGRENNFRFRILDDFGKTVQSFEQHHERPLHLIVIRRDLKHFQHLHPQIDQTGTWSVPLTLPEAGVYRIFTDFLRYSQAVTLGVDLAVVGNMPLNPPPKPSSVARTGGYEVHLETRELKTATNSLLSFVITQDGKPVQGLGTYLGARGHLVALREGDLAYLHVHAMNSNDTKHSIQFHAAFPSFGRYRLFLEFSHSGVIHRAEFSVEVPASAADQAS